MRVAYLVFELVVRSYAARVSLIVACSIAGQSCALIHHYPPGFDLPSLENLIERAGYLASISYRLKMPNWVAERLDHTSHIKIGSRKKAKFRPDPQVPDSFQATDRDYHSSGWSRGHLAAAGLHSQSQSNTDETFLLSANIVPQDIKMNCGDWLRLEKFAASLVKDQPDRVIWSLSGPLWIPTVDSKTGQRYITHEVIGDNDIPVPTHLFKILALEICGKAVSSSAFVMPNIPLNTQRSISDYRADISDIEKVAGLNLAGLKCPTELCTVVLRAAKDTVENTQLWRYTLLLKRARNIKDVRKVVSKAIKKGLFTKRNPELVSLVTTRIKVFTDEDPVTALFPDPLNPQRKIAAAAFELSK